MNRNRTIGIAMFVLGVSLTGQIRAASSKEQLLGVIGNEQNVAEKNIIKRWMQGERGREFEILLADYVSREVRYRTMSGEADNGTLLATVNAEQKNGISSPVELGRLLVLEYFKRKGVNLKDKRFVKGSYVIGMRKEIEQSMQKPDGQN